MKRLILIALGVILLTGGVSYSFFSKQKSSNQITNPSPIPSSPQEKLSPTQKTENVPLPTEEDIIRVFFNLIDEDKIPQAISMMDESVTNDDSKKQSWGVNFGILESVSVESVEPSFKEEWTDEWHSYKVVLTLKIRPGYENAPIPNYGWENGQNVRWVGLVKNKNKVWKISGLATGP